MSSDAWSHDGAPGTGSSGEAPGADPTAPPPPTAPGGEGPNPYGMGPVGSGPGFAPPAPPVSPAVGPNPYGGPSHPVPPPRGPKRSKLPAIITAAAILVVALILVGGTVRARVEPEATSSAPPAPTPSALPSSSEDSIAFTSSEGSGRLTLVSSRWSTEGSVDPSTGQYLQITLRISATEGRISYGPQYFQVFDSQGTLFRTTGAGVRRQPLDDGRLRADESVTGTIAFDMPRDTVTLLMSNARMETVTALRIVE
jgi:hypothetical protein